MQVLNWDKQTQKKVRRDYLAEVRQSGDTALRRYTREFDGIDLPLKRLAVTQGDINRAFEKIQVPFVPLLKQITENVREYYEKELKKSFEIAGPNGVHLGKRYEPLDRVGIYIPAGTAPLVSTV